LTGVKERKCSPPEEGGKEGIKLKCWGTIRGNPKMAGGKTGAGKKVKKRVDGKGGGN